MLFFIQNKFLVLLIIKIIVNKQNLALNLQ